MEVVLDTTARGARPEHLLECVNQPADKWAIRWGLTETDDDWEWQEAWVSPRPSLDDIHAFLLAKSKEEEQAVMDAGFDWEGMRIKMDADNQENFKQQFDLQLAGLLPIEANYFFGERSEITYTFPTMEKLQAWILAMAVFKQEVKNRYVANRLAINLNDYAL